MKNFAQIKGTNKAVVLPTGFNLWADYDAPQEYTSALYDLAGRVVDYRERRYMIDHDETGTATPGTGDTIAILID